MQPILYHARLLLDANIRSGPPDPLTGELQPTIGPYLQIDTIVQVIAETDHSPNPNAVWLQINYWQLQLDGTHVYRPGWVRQLKYVAGPPVKYLPVTKVVFCPPEVFQVSEVVVPPPPPVSTIEERVQVLEREAFIAGWNLTP